MRIAQEKALDAQADATRARSPVALLEDGSGGKGSGKEEDEKVGKGGHAELESFVRKLQKELRGKDEKLKESEERVKEKDEEIKRLKNELREMVKGDDK